jgi:hypothetical protein
MFKMLALSISMLVSTAFAVDATGTWKLNTTKSKYTGMPMPKEMTVVYTPVGTGWRYEASGISGAGDPIKSSFTYVKDGADISTMGFPNWDTLVLNNAKANKATGVMKRQGKQVGTITRVISADGKTMTIQGNATTPDGKKVSYVSVYDKQ